MSETRSTYDESNELWPYFVITLLSVLLVPATLSQLVRFFGQDGKKRAVKPIHARFRTTRQREDALSSTTLWLIAVGWVILAMLVHFVRSLGQDVDGESSVSVWDPYALLEIGTSATSKEIRSAYRKLSLQFHPDKVKDLAESTKEAINAKYVEISKAYRALTDEDTRENFLLYGHPDGPQQVTHGIALPAFLFDPAGSLTFVSLYLFGFGVAVPLVVSKWWTASQRRTRRGLLQETASQFSKLLVKEQAHFITKDRVLREILTSADMDEAVGTTLTDFEARRAVLESYLKRETSQTTTELTIAVETARLLMGLHDFAAEFKSFGLCQRLLQMHRAVVQAVPFEITQEGEYAQLNGADLSAVLQKKPNETQIQDVMKDARSYFPKLHLLRAEFKVSGEEAVIPNSRVFLQFKFLVLPLGDKVPEISEEEISAIGNDSETTQLLDPDAQNKKHPALPDAVTPHYPLDVPTRWYAYVYGVLDNRLAEKPLEITNVDLHNLKLSREELANGESLVIGTINVALSSVSPPQAGSFPFKAALISSTYFGTDIKSSVTMNVVNPPPSSSTSAVDEDDDLDLENEDKQQDDESDEEIEGLSDIDTSTEEEDNAEDNA